MIKQFIIIALGLSLFSFGGAQELKQIMIRSGETFTKIQRAILADKNLGPETQAACNDLSFLFGQAKSQVPDLSKITNDPLKRKELLAQYQEIMSHILGLSEDLEVLVVNQKLPEATEQVKKLRDIKKDAHAIFAPNTNGGPK